MTLDAKKKGEKESSKHATDLRRNHIKLRLVLMENQIVDLRARICRLEMKDEIEILNEQAEILQESGWTPLDAKD